MSLTLNPRQRDGYVLVMTVFVLAIVGMLLVGISSHSLGLATDAALARRDLQDKWAVASCQKYALMNAADLLNDGQTALANSVARIRLNETDIEIVLADESAKLDVNFLWANTNPANAKSVIREISGRQKLSTTLRPLDRQYQDARNDAFEGWGQVFSTEEFVPDFSLQIFGATQHLTCWSQRLNYRTAPEEVIFNAVKVVCGAAVAQRLASAVSRDSELTLPQILDEVTTNDRQRERLRGLLTNRSTSQSVWIRSYRDGKSSSTLTVNEQLTGTINRLYTFAW